MTTEHPPLHVPARDLPVPASVSTEARAFLGVGMRPSAAGWPPLDDLDAWRERIAAQDAQMLASVGGVTTEDDVAVDDLDVGGARVFVVTPHGAPSGRVLLDVHGGGLVLGRGDSCRVMAVRTARFHGTTTWSVDYRMPPDDPYPAGLDDCVAAYRGLLERHRPDEIVVTGPSAGANLAAALVLRARDEGLPLPAATVLLSPEIDLTESGDSFATNAGVDTVIASFLPVNHLYAAGHDLAHPYLSPLFGDFAQGFPPTLLTAGTRDLFLSNAVRMHRALRGAGIEAELHVMEAAPHGGFFGTAPEDADLAAEVRRFVAGRWPA